MNDEVLSATRYIGRRRCCLLEAIGAAVAAISVAFMFVRVRRGIMRMWSVYFDCLEDARM